MGLTVAFVGVDVVMKWTYMLMEVGKRCSWLACSLPAPDSGDCCGTLPFGNNKLYKDLCLLIAHIVLFVIVLVK